ncbi:hypothetical protein TNCT_71221 [Trichonephila clavata]|uniref:Uncharacterized protein n=1 Tax=Trichonephila clavata TaxID=2740835 RepID=A0A8X6LC34_TRICU|nr:hypothetical protein TNCT_71221 [Trichonephila clavata]
MDSNGRGQKRKNEEIESSDSEDEGRNVDQGLPRKKRMTDVEVKNPMLRPRAEISKWMGKNLANESETQQSEATTSPESMEMKDFEPPRFFNVIKRRIIDSAARPSTSTDYFGAHDEYCVFVPSSEGSSLSTIPEEDESYETLSGSTTETAEEEFMEEDE